MTADLENQEHVGTREKFLRLFKNRPDSEHEQAAIRVAIVFFIFLYLSCAALFAEESDAAIIKAVAIAGALLLGSIILLANVLVRPGPAIIRRLFSLCADLTATSYTLFLVGEMSVPLVGLYLWITIGNGFRYGQRYLLVATLLSIAGFSTVIFTSAFWSDHLDFGVGILVTLAVIPAYASTLVRKLNKAVKRANAANAAKSQFLANMSHEFRTPLNGVIGMALLLRDSALNLEQKDLVRSIHASAETLLGLVEDVLDISKIEAGKLTSEVVDYDLHALVSNTALMFRYQAKQKGLELTAHTAPEIPFLMRGDPMHVRQILINLMGNALKFTEHGRMDIRVRPVSRERNGLTIRFEVSDTGIGIPDEVQPRIFESFTQADDSVTRRYGGTGLGTAISKQLVTLMGGRIGFTSLEGKGTTFWFELPFEFQPESDRSVHREPIPNSASVLVLARDEIAQPLENILRAWNLRTQRTLTSARTFTRLVEAAEQSDPFQIVIIERQYLDLDVHQFVTAVKSEATLHDLSLVLLDLAFDAAQVEGFLRAGYSSVLKFPVDKTLLFNALHAAHTEHASQDNVVSFAAHYRERGTLSGLHILVAEDNNINRLVLRKILERAGHSSLIVNDGEEALEVLERGDAHFDALILDMNMPGRGGLEVARAYRFMFARAAAPVIILTANATPEAALACKEAGVDVYLTKPVDPKRLLDVIADLAIRNDAHESGGGYSSQKSSFAPDGADPVATIDEVKLDNLIQLEDGSGFVEELVAGFARDGERTLALIDAAVRVQDYPALRDAVHALKGSAGELGATLLMDACTRVELLKPYELNTEHGYGLTDELHRLFDRTCNGLTAFVDSQIIATT